MNSLGHNDKGKARETGGLYAISGTDYIHPRGMGLELTERNLNQMICNMSELGSMQLAWSIS